MRMNISKLPIKDAYLIIPEPKIDERGLFTRTFCRKLFQNAGLNSDWVQMNRSVNEHSHTLRGLHYQTAPSQEEKLVSCTKGRVFDVVVDLRRTSPSYGQWAGVELSDDNQYQVYVPKGVAHGYITMLPRTEVIYLVSSYYSSENERSLNWADQSINIKWPLNPKHISLKDSNALSFESVAL